MQTPDQSVPAPTPTPTQAPARRPRATLGIAALAIAAGAIGSLLVSQIATPTVHAQANRAGVLDTQALAVTAPLRAVQIPADGAVLVTRSDGLVFIVYASGRAVPVLIDRGDLRVGPGAEPLRLDTFAE